MGSGRITLYHGQGQWSSEIIGRNGATHDQQTFTLVHDDREKIRTLNHDSDYPEEEEWTRKLQEIYSFQVTNAKMINSEQKDQLVAVFNLSLIHIFTCGLLVRFCFV